LNSNDFHFDTEIIIQLFRAHLRIKEVPIPTYYGNEICHVNGLKYAFNVIKATVLSRAQDLGILYEPKFDSAGPHTGRGHYQAKLSFVSPHTLALERIRSGSSVADIGCAGGYMATALRDKRCQVIGIDQYDVADDVPLHRFIRHDLDRANFPIDLGQFEYVLLLDVIEHLKSPETFVANLRVAATRGEDTSLIVSTANVGFLIPRLMLLFGCFYYGPRGILDLTHTRLFTFATLRRLFEQAGYVVEEIRGIPAPFPLAFGDGAFARLLLDGNRLLIRLWRGLFSYQIFMVVRPLPSLKVLLKRAVESSSASAAVS